jgi:hypothetical protein
MRHGGTGRALYDCRMIAAAGGPSIRCAPYAPYPTEELSRAVGHCLRCQRVNQITLATTAIAIAVPNVTTAATWNRRRCSGELPTPKTAGMR